VSGHGLHDLRACVLTFAQSRRRRGRRCASHAIARRLFERAERIKSLDPTSVRWKVHVRSMLRPGGRSHSNPRTKIQRARANLQSVGGICKQCRV